MRGLARELEGADPDCGIDRPRLEAERLLCRVLGIGRAELAATGSRRLEAEEARELAGLVSRRLAGEPLQHLEGAVAFRELVLVADRRALLPRPETEQLVEEVVRWARGRAEGEVRTVRRPGGRDRPPLDGILDIGVGSGAIALSLLQEGVARRAVGLDASPLALEQAVLNRERVGVEAARLELRRVDGPLWEAVGREERFDLLVSNPPYVTEEEMAELPRQIREHEPAMALRGGADGLELVREILEGASRHVVPGGALFLELGEGQPARVRERLREDTAWARVDVLRDLAGRERFLRALAREEGGRWD